MKNVKYVLFNSRNDELKVAMQSKSLILKEKNIENALYADRLFLIHHLINLVTETKKGQRNFVGFGQFFL